VSYYIMQDKTMLTEKEFIALIEKYLEGKATPQEQEIVNGFYNKLSEEMPAAEEEIRRRGREVWDALRQNTQKTEAPMDHSMSRIISGIAASFLLIIAFFFGLRQAAKTDHEPLVQVITEEITVHNNLSEAKKILLPDGSEVLLQSGGKLTVKPFCNTREAALEGEAFFKVAPDKNHPFKVYSQGLVTTVLGTSFTIKANPSDNAIVVNVKTGKVAVSRSTENGAAKEYCITPNQEVVYYKKANKLQVQLQENPQVVIAPDELLKMNFDEASATEVFAALERAYNMDLVFDEAAFANCTITTQLHNEGFYDRLDIICRLLNAEYETVETKIYVRGGCN